MITSHLHWLDILLHLYDSRNKQRICMICIYIPNRTLWYWVGMVNFTPFMQTNLIEILQLSPCVGHNRPIIRPWEQYMDSYLDSVYELFYIIAFAKKNLGYNKWEIWCCFIAKCRYFVASFHFFIPNKIVTDIKYLTALSFVVVIVYLTARTHIVLILCEIYTANESLQRFMYIQMRVCMCVCACERLC